MRAKRPLEITPSPRDKRAMHSLPIFVTLKDQPVVLTGEGDAVEAKRRLIERAGGRVIDEHDIDEGARIGFVAFPDDARATAAARRLKERGLLVNVADRPALCDFTLPAIVDRDPVLIAVGTAGRSAGLAKALRQRIEALLPASLGRLAEALFAARGTIRGRWPEARDRREAIDAALAPGGPLDPFTDSAAEHVHGWAARGEGGDGISLAVIRLRSGDPDDLTLGEARLLARADCIYHRPDVPDAILARARADAVRKPCARPPFPRVPGLSIDLGFL